MSRGLPAAFLVAAFALLLAQRPAVSSHKGIDHDPVAPFTGANTPRAVIVEYFTASKNGDAARASSLIDYDEWGRRRGLEGERARQWHAEHRAALDQDYRLERAAGSTKEFEIIKETVERETAVFEITQERADGLYWWDVTVALKRGRWAIVDFRLSSVRRQGG
jgi:hypothetical protein